MLPPRTPLDAFRQEGAELTKNIAAFYVPSKEIPALRQWLDDAPVHAQPEDMVCWGKLMLSLVDVLRGHGNPVMADSKDAQRLGVYLHAMAKLPAQHWDPPSSNLVSTTNTESPYETFRQMMIALGPKKVNHGDALFRQLLLSNTWQPDDLLQTLEGLCLKPLPAWHDTAQSLLFQALLPRMQDTAWRPADTDLYGSMWATCRIDESPEDPQCAVLLAKSTPSQTGRMLRALLHSNRIAPEAIAPFFPLQVSTCDALSILDPLIGLLTEGGREDLTYKAKIVAEELERHHPQLSNLLQMHLTLFPEVEEYRTLATLLVPGFDALYQRPVEPAMGFSGDFFETMNHE